MMNATFVELEQAFKASTLSLWTLLSSADYCTSNRGQGVLCVWLYIWYVI
jgi:hypothetical protein